MTDTQKLIRTVLFYGGIWGLCEATLGYLLHLLPCGFSGMIMFPIGFGLMTSAWRISGSRSAMAGAALIAVAIKLADLLIPLQPAIRTLNPVVAILLEALVVVGFVTLFNDRHVLLKTVSMGFSWVLLLIAAQAVLRPADGLYLKPFPEMLGFILLNAGVSGLLAGGYLRKADWSFWRPRLPRLALLQSFGLIAIAIICELANSLL